MELVPETPPSSVTCVADGARSLRVRWTPPRASHDSLRGYDVLYAPLHNVPSEYIASNVINPTFLSR